MKQARDSAGLAEYKQNGEWDLLGNYQQQHHEHQDDHVEYIRYIILNVNISGVPSRRNEVPFDGEPYVDVTFTIKMRRRSLY